MYSKLITFGPKAASIIKEVSMRSETEPRYFSGIDWNVSIEQRVRICEVLQVGIENKTSNIVYYPNISLDTQHY